MAVTIAENANTKEIYDYSNAPCGVPLRVLDNDGLNTYCRIGDIVMVLCSISSHQDRFIVLLENRDYPCALHIPSYPIQLTIVPNHTVIFTGDTND